MWRTVALVTATPTTTEVRAGHITADLDPAGLVLRLRSVADMRPLAYGLVQLRSNDGTRTVADQKYTPTADPQQVRIDPGPMAAGFSGSVCFIPRAYNLRWLQAGVPRTTWPVWIEAWLPLGAVEGDAVVPGYRDLSGRRLAPDPAVGPGEAVELIYV